MKVITRVLVIKLGSIGDFVLSLPAMQRIRHAHPKAHITLLTRPGFEGLARASGLFSHIEPSGDVRGLGAAWTLAGWIRRAGFDRVYDLENSALTHRVFRSMWPRRPAWSGDVRGASLRHANDQRSRMHLQERQADQLRAAGIWPDAPTEPGQAPPPDLSWILRRAPAPRPAPGAGKPRPYVVLAPGGASKARERWPIENYAALAGALAEQGFDIVVVGAPEESGLARTIQRVVRNARDLTGRTDFAQVAVLGARAALAVGANSGPIQLMAAAGAPTIALVPQEIDPDLSGPRGYVAIIRARSLKALTVRQVAETAKALARSA